MNNKNKIQKSCKLKEVIDKTYITCFMEGKCSSEIVGYSNGRIILRSPKAKNPITRFFKNNIKSKNC